MKDGKPILGNSVLDMMRFGYVMFEFNFPRLAWIGVDADGTEWVLDENQWAAVKWAEVECDGRWYRCVKPSQLRMAEAVTPSGGV